MLRFLSFEMPLLILVRGNFLDVVEDKVLESFEAYLETMFENTTGILSRKLKNIHKYFNLVATSKINLDEYSARKFAAITF